MDCKTQVLETLKTLGDAPKPFAQSAQYKNNIKGKSDADPDESELAEAEKPRPGRSSKAKKKLRPDVKKAKCGSTAAKKTAAAASESQPWIYSKLKAEYIESMVTSAGVGRSQATEAWNQSSQKRKFLATVPVNELRRRRFIAKGCNHNPWAN